MSVPSSVCLNLYPAQNKHRKRVAQREQKSCNYKRGTLIRIFRRPTKKIPYVPPPFPPTPTNESARGHLTQNYKHCTDPSMHNSTMVRHTLRDEMCQTRAPPDISFTRPSPAKEKTPPAKKKTYHSPLALNTGRPGVIFSCKLCASTRPRRQKTHASSAASTSLRAASGPTRPNRFGSQRRESVGFPSRRRNGASGVFREDLQGRGCVALRCLSLLFQK